MYWRMDNSSTTAATAVHPSWSGQKTLYTNESSLSRLGRSLHPGHIRCRRLQIRSYCTVNIITLSNLIVLSLTDHFFSSEGCFSRKTYVHSCGTGQEKRDSKYRRDYPQASADEGNLFTVPDLKSVNELSNYDRIGPRFVYQFGNNIMINI